MVTVEIWVMNVLTMHKVASRWIRHNFDASACFDGCNNIAEVWERLQRIRIDVSSLPRIGFSVVFTIGLIVFIVHLCYLCSCSQLSSFPLGLCILERV